MPSFKLWNRAIFNYFFSEKEGRHVALSTDAETLRAAMRKQRDRDDFDTLDDVRQDFVAEVKEEYARRQCRWRMLKPSGEDIPDYLPFLAAEVLAAFSVGEEMEDSDSSSDESFWAHLKAMFGSVTGLAV